MNSQFKRTNRSVMYFIFPTMCQLPVDFLVAAKIHNLELHDRLTSEKSKAKKTACKYVIRRVLRLF